MRSITLFLLLFLALGIELGAGCAGIPLYLTAGVVFYAACVYGAPYGFSAAAAGGLVLDLVPGYFFPYSVLSLSLVAAGGYLWLRKVDSDSLLLLMIPGAFLPVAGYLLPELIHGDGGLDNIVTILSTLLIDGVISAVFFPLWILLLDIPGNLLDLGVFSDAKARFLRKEQL